jgi:hypothetical protein
MSEVRIMKALLIPAAAVALLAGCVGYGDQGGYGPSGYGYGYGYPGSYGGAVLSNSYPGTVYAPSYPAYQQSYPYAYGAYPNAYPNAYPYPNNGVVRNRDIDGDGIRNRDDRDRDGDGIRNRADRDRDGDGVPNRADARPNNPARR